MEDKMTTCVADMKRVLEREDANNDELRDAAIAVVYAAGLDLHTNVIEVLGGDPNAHLGASEGPPLVLHVSLNPMHCPVTWLEPEEGAPRTRKHMCTLDRGHGGRCVCSCLTMPGD